MKKATSALLLAGLAVSACLQAQAAEPQATQPQATADATDATNAVMVGIDAKTGKLRPLTAAEAKALSAKAAAMPRQVSKSSTRAPRTPEEARATVRRHADGSMSMRAPLSAMSAVQAVRAADGSLQFLETDGNGAPAAPQSQEVSE